MTEGINDMEMLRAQADRLGIKYHPAIGEDKLREKIKEYMEMDKSKTVIKGTESITERNTRLRKEANKLVRIRLTCMNPNKKNWPGEIISVSNSAIGTIKKFIPFNEEAYHVPKVILTVLKEREYLSTKTVKIDGKIVKRKQQNKEFAIEELPSLTVDELKSIADRQLLNKA